MGKSTKNPSYSTGSVTVNGQQKASVGMNGNTVNASYNMNDTEKKIYDYAQNSFLESLPNVNIFSDQTLQNLQNQVNAYTQKGIKTLNNIYDPMLSNLKTDIASRFGNFDNSSFLDSLNNIEPNRADAVSALTQDIMSQQNSLINDELSRRYNYLNLLSGIQNNADANAMNYIQQAFAQSKSGTDYNLQTRRNDFNALNTYANLLTPVAGSLLKSIAGTENSNSDKSSNSQINSSELVNTIIQLLPLFLA